MIKQTNIDRYKNFGLKEEWVDGYMVDRNDYWTSNHGLNENYQIPALKSWLRDAEIIDSKNNITELGELLADHREDFSELIWEIIWINLSYNSFIVQWFNTNIPVGATYNQKDLEALLREQYPSYKEKTTHNAVYQLLRTLKESPIGSEFQQLEVLDKNYFKRGAHDDISNEALAYSLYKYASLKNVHSLRISDFYTNEIAGGVAKEFAISKSTFGNKLRSLNSNTNRVLTAELNMGLDSITLREDLNPITCLKMLIE